MYCLDNDPPDLQFKENGYLILGSESGSSKLLEIHDIQKSCGANWMQLFNSHELSSRFPWLSTENVAIGSLSTRNEGNIS